MTKNLLDRFRIADGRKLRLTYVRPDDTRGLKSEEDAREDPERRAKCLFDRFRVAASC